MGVTTSFFSATIEQLEAAAPGWLRAEYGAPFEKTAVNPFTGEPLPMVIRGHELLTPTPENCPPDTIDSLIKPNRAYAWKLMGNELAPLMKRLTKASDDEVAQLNRYALIGPSSVDYWVFQIPDRFMHALAGLSPAEIPKLAKAWQKKLEWESPPTAILEQLVEVAREAREAGQRMFSYVSL